MSLYAGSESQKSLREKVVIQYIIKNLQPFWIFSINIYTKKEIFFLDKMNGAR